MGSGRPLTRAEVADLADRLRALLGQIDAGNLDATRAMRYRLEGAIAALDAALGRPSTLLGDLLGDLPGEPS
jgi:hypothetical protein